MCSSLVDKGNNPKEPNFQQITTYCYLIYNKNHMHLSI
jgi:hypothetical protein